MFFIKKKIDFLNYIIERNKISVYSIKFQTIKSSLVFVT